MNRRERGLRQHEPAPASSEWFTPQIIFDKLDLVFDLDPCHPGRDNPHCVVPARKIYTKAENGLLQPWNGLVFCNPPHSDQRRGVVPWLRKFIAHASGILLCPARTSSDWWHDVLLPSCPLICFTNGKTKFVRPDGSVGKEPSTGNALLAMGDVACDALRRSGIGVCVIVDSASVTDKGSQRARSETLSVTA
jgi:hypothetical protein